MISTVPLRLLSSQPMLHNFPLPDLNSAPITTTTSRLRHCELSNDEVSFCSTSKNDNDGQTTSLSQLETSEKQSTSSLDSAETRIELKLRTESDEEGAVADAVAVACADDETLAERSRGEESERVDETSEKKLLLEKKEKGKRSLCTFSIALTREKIEADLLAMGAESKRISRSRSRSRRMKKRVAQRELDHLFPGLRLKFISADEDYRVRDHML